VGHNRRAQLMRRATFKAEVMWPPRPSPVVSNVPSNITMTVIAALINAGPAASRRHVTPPGFNAILSGVPAPPPSVLLHVRAFTARG